MKLTIGYDRKEGDMGFLDGFLSRKRLGEAFLLVFILALFPWLALPVSAQSTPQRDKIQPPPPETSTSNGEIILTYRFYEGDIPFIVTVKHKDTGHGPLEMGGYADELDIWIGINVDCGEWVSQGNLDTTCPAVPYLVVGIEDSERHPIVWGSGEGGFLKSSWAMAAGASTSLTLESSGTYRLGATVFEPGNEVFETFISVEIEQSDHAATDLQPDEANSEQETSEEGDESEADFADWLPILGFGALLGLGGLAGLGAAGYGLYKAFSGSGKSPPAPAPAQPPSEADDYWKVMEDLEKSVQKMDQMTDDLQDKVDAERKEFLKSDQKFYQEIAAIWEEAAEFAEFYEAYAKAIKFGADRGVDICAGLIGPAGTPLKELYVFTTNLIEGIFTGIHEDGSIASGAIKGASKGGYDIAFGRLFDLIHGNISIGKESPITQKTPKFSDLLGAEYGKNASVKAILDSVDSGTWKDILKSTLGAGVGYLEGEFIGNPIYDKFGKEDVITQPFTWNHFKEKGMSIKGAPAPKDNAPGLDTLRSALSEGIGYLKEDLLDLGAEPWAWNPFL